MKNLLAKLLTGIVAFGIAASAHSLTIVPTFDSSITNDPQATAMIAAINGAIQVFEANIADNVTITILFASTNSGLGTSFSPKAAYSYPTYLTALRNRATSPYDATALGRIPNGTDPVLGGNRVWMTYPLARLMGLTNVTAPGGYDSMIFLKMSLMNLARPPGDLQFYDLQQVTEHEMDEVLGSSSDVPFSLISPIDLFRYTTNLARTYTTNGDDAYFSIDGTNLLARYNMHAPGDYSDLWSFTGSHWAPPGIAAHAQVQDAYTSPGNALDLGNYELVMLDVIGWTLTANAESFLNPPAIGIAFPAPGAVLSDGPDLVATGSSTNDSAAVGSVQVSLSRGPDGAWFDFISGGWGTASFDSNRDILTATGTSAWSAPLPPLPNATYSLSARAVDVYHHASPWKAVSFTVNVAAPIVTFFPLTNTEVVFDFSQIGGSLYEASADHAAVTFRIEQLDTGGINNTYWNGSSWIANGGDPSVYLNAAVTSSGWTPGAGVTLPTRGQTRYGPYVLRAIASDDAGNTGTNEIQVTRSATDTTPPIVTLDNFHNGDLITNLFLPAISGSALDFETGIAYVNVYLNRFTGGGYLYWNGTNWTATPATLPLTYNAQTVAWQVTVPLPSGANLPNAGYQIQVSVANNESPAQTANLIVGFSVDYHPVFVFNYGSQFGPSPNMNWNDPANWNVGSVPTPDARVVINGFSPDNTSLGSLKLYRLDLSAGTLTTSGMLITNLNISGGALTGGAIGIPANGVFNWSGGTISGAYNVPAGATINLAGSADKIMYFATLTNNGAGYWNGGNILASYLSVINNNNTFVIQSSGSFYNNTGGLPGPTFNNNGWLQKTNSNGYTTLTPDVGGWIFNQNGTVDVENGALSSQAQFNVNDGAIFAGPGETRIDGGTILINGTNTIQPGATVELAGGTWNGSNVFTGSGNFVWSGGTISQSTVSLSPAIAFNIVGAADKGLTFSTINWSGLGTWTGTGKITASYASAFNNNGTFIAQNDSSFFNYSGGLPAPVFVNNGAFVKTNSSGTNATTFGSDPNGGVAFNNNGSVTVRSGNLFLSGGGAENNGSFAVAAGSQIELTAGSFFVTGNMNLAGAGSTQMTGGALNFGNTVTALTAGSTFEFANGDVSGTNTFAGPGTFVWSGGVIHDIETISSNIAFNISGAADKGLTFGTINWSGPGTWTGTGRITASYASAFNNNGTFIVQNDSSFFNYSGGLPAPVFVNNGSFVKTNSSGTNATTFGSDPNGGVAFNNNGSVNVRSGNLFLAGGGAGNNGSLAVAAGSHIDFTLGSFSLAGTLNLSGAGSTRFTGGAFNFGNTVSTMTAGSTFELANGDVSGTNTFAGTGTFVWSGGVIHDVETLPANIAFNITGAADKGLTFGTINWSGPGTWTGTGRITASYASAFNNNGTFIVQNDSSFFNYSGGLPAPVFVNNGSFVKTNSTGTNATTFGSDPNGGVAFNNNGSVNVRSGNLFLAGGGAGNNGSFATAAGSHVDLLAGAFSLAGNLNFSGAGSTRVNGGALNFGNTVSAMTAGGTFELVNGSIAGTNTFAGTGTCDWSGGLIAGVETLPANMGFNITGPADKTLSFGTINWSGLGTWTGTGKINASYTSAFNNNGTFIAQNDSSFFNYTGGLPGPVFVNNGTFRKNITTGTTVFGSDPNGGVAFNQNGIVDLQTGILAINGLNTSAGSPQLHLAVGGTNAGTQFSQETFAGAATLGGLLSVTLANGFTPTNGQSFAVVAYPSESGQFASQQLPALPNNLAWQVTYGDTAVTLNVVRSTATLITNPTRLDNGHFQFTLNGPNATSALVQVSTNLMDWSPLQTNTPFTGLLLLDDAKAVGIPMRFYRVMIQP